MVMLRLNPRAFIKTFDTFCTNFENVNITNLVEEDKISMFRIKI